LFPLAGLSALELSDCQIIKKAAGSKNAPSRKQAVAAQITHLRPPNLQADYEHLKHFQVTLQTQKVLISGNFVGLN
jgi:hypothetical protein